MNRASAPNDHRSLTRRALLTRSTQRISAPTDTSGSSPANAAAEWTSHTSGLCGASISCPISWGVDADANVNLLYPHQSFVVRNAAPPRRSPDDLPDLTSYSVAGVYLWLLYYDHLLPSPDCPPFEPLRSYNDLEQRISEFTGFMRYGISFSGTRRSFALRLWIGAAASPHARSSLNACLSSLKVP
jgi:hypothetical protein